MQSNFLLQKIPPHHLTKANCVNSKAAHLKEILQLIEDFSFIIIIII